jgi:hypothetical protein
MTREEAIVKLSALPPGAIIYGLCSFENKYTPADVDDWIREEDGQWRFIH